MTQPTCRPARTLLASGPFCAVEECACGVLHVTLGALTIRLQADVVLSLWETLGEALARASAGEPSQPSLANERPGRPGPAERPS